VGVPLALIFAWGVHPDFTFAFPACALWYGYSRAFVALVSLLILATQILVHYSVFSDEAMVNVIGAFGGFLLVLTATLPSDALGLADARFTRRDDKPTDDVSERSSA
jgi:hypothetical protein